MTGQDDVLDRISRLEERFEKLEERYQQLANRVGDNYSQLQSSIAAEIKSVITMVSEIERRLGEKQDKIAETIGKKIDEQAHASWSTKILILLGAFGWIITLAAVIITLIVSQKP